MPGYTYTFFYRKCQKSHFSYSISGTVTTYILYHTYSDTIATQIGEGLYIGHFGSIIVNPDAVIGRNFCISAGTLVGSALGKKKGCANYW